MSLAGVSTACMLALMLGPNVGKEVMSVNQSQATFVIVHPEMPDSFDPLDADRIRNLPAARMVYSTPIEVSVKNTLVSQLLSNFTYDPNTFKMEWTLRPGVAYSDGSLITSEDIAFSVARMLKARPEFPVIRDISGLKEWLSQSRPLENFPKGIEVSSDKITIQFDRKVSNPFFRFTLELFSVIPKRCVDLTTGKLICDAIPSSGNYILAKSEADSIYFQKFRSANVGHEIPIPDMVKFRYKGVSHLTSMPDNSVAMLSEYSIKVRGLDLKEIGLRSRWAPASDFVSILISPLVKPFDNVICRRIFSEALRSAVASEARLGGGFEASLFPPMIPGYLPGKRLGGEIAGSDRSSCIEYMRTHPIPWARLPESEKYFTDELIVKAANILQVPLQNPHILNVEGDGWIESFNSGKAAFYPFMTGFWALDPVGDIRMLFTPHLHEDLKQVWQDPKLQNLLLQLVNLSEGEGIREKLEEINRYNYERSVFNPIMQSRKVYVSKESDMLEAIPLAVQQPYPWQVFLRH